MQSDEIRRGKWAEIRCENSRGGYKQRLRAWWVVAERASRWRVVYDLSPGELKILDIPSGTAKCTQRLVGVNYWNWICHAERPLRRVCRHVTYPGSPHRERHHRFIFLLHRAVPEGKRRRKDLI